MTLPIPEMVQSVDWLQMQAFFVQPSQVESVAIWILFSVNVLTAEM